MRIIDFSRSFLWWRVDTLKKPPQTASHVPPFTLNNARVPLDCLCHLEEKEGGGGGGGGGGGHRFALGASCKTERVGVERELWTEPNSDFVPILSDTQMLGVKTFQKAHMEVPLHPPSRGSQPERQLVDVAEAFDNARTDLAFAEGELLAGPAEVVEAVLGNRILVGRTAYEDERYRVQLEYPIKTVNANERDGFFQPDTGPVLLPDLSREPADLMAGLELAYIAFNQPDWAEFLVRVPTKVAPGVEVYHYSLRMRVDCVNEVVVVD